ncbi:MAG: hypothetical protein HFI63_02890 [Lachnospiraceae bacterium]|nr:hypothetical protein [Lachnospiraceae bacterium]
MGAYYPDGNGKEYNDEAAYDRGGTTAAQKAVKDCGSSALFLAATLCYTGAVMLYVYTDIFGQGSDGDLWRAFLQNYTRFQKFGIAGMVLTVVQFVPLVLIAVGMWRFYLACKGEGIPSAGGVMMARAGMLFNLILGIISAVLSIGFGILVFVETSGGHGGGHHVADGRAAILGMIIGLALLLVLLIVYYRKAIRCADIVRDICQRGETEQNLPVILIVANFALAFFSVLGLLGKINTQMQEQLDFVILAGGVFQIVPEIAMGICILKLRERLFLV